MVCEQTDQQNRIKSKFRPNTYGIQYMIKVKNPWGKDVLLK